MRIAFLADPLSVSDERLDAIFQYNLTRWGGRLNPIIFSDGERIEDEWWRFLIGFDPDVVFPLMTLSEQLKEEIRRRVSPLSMEDFREPEGGIRFSVHTLRDGVSVYPDPESLESLAHFIRIGAPRLVAFDVDDADEVIRLFIARNFGVYYKTIFMDSVLEKIDVANFEITDVESLAKAIDAVSSPVPRAWIYPRQFSILAGTWPPVAWNYGRDAFTVVIGESAKDVTHYWNHPLTVAASNRKGINEIWLPTVLARDDQLRSVLPRWFRKLGGWMHGADQPIQFVTHSLNETDLQLVVDGLIPKGEFYPTQSSRLTSAQIPEFEAASAYASFSKTTDMSWHAGSGKGTLLSIDGPAPSERSAGYWMSDIHIQYDLEKLGYQSNQEFMWQFPRRDQITWQIFKREGRVNSEHYPSVLMSGPLTSLEVALPSEVGLFCQLIMKETSPFKYAKSSEKGHYLAGIIELFSGLFQAYCVLEEQYWRHLFSEMSLRESRASVEAIDEIKTLFRRTKGLELSEEHAAAKVLEVARRVFKKGTDLCVADLAAKANEWGHNLEWLHLDWHVQDFIESNIFRVGLSSKCDRCGYRDWHHIDEVRQTITCSGCGYLFPLHIKDEKWHFRLNSLLRAGVAEHGSIPVILTLGKLLRESRKSFIFAPSLDLFEDPEKERWGDLDIVCIQDGRLVLGEVKTSVSGFGSDDFYKMEVVAKHILPDVLIFSAERGCASDEPREPEKVGLLRTELKPLRIEVRWLCVGSDESGLTPG